jgi:hypothetical protein
MAGVKRLIMAVPYSGVVQSITEPILEHINTLPEELFFFLEGKEKNGIFMHHGISDKGYHKIERLKQIKHLLYPGPAWKDKLVSQGIPAEKIHLVGWPPLDQFFQGKIKIESRSRPRVVWCPTHDAIKVISSYPSFEKYLDKLPDKYEVISSVHPARRENRETSLELIANADVVISDTSSMLYEALIIGKPVILLDFLVKDGVFSLLKGTFEEKLYRENLCYHVKNFYSMPEIIEEALVEGIDKRTMDFIEYFYPTEFRGKSGELTAKKLEELIR